MIASASVSPTGAQPEPEGCSQNGRLPLPSAGMEAETAPLPRRKERLGGSGGGRG